MRYIIANWKMNMDLEKVYAWINTWESLKTSVKKSTSIVIAPSTVHIPVLKILEKVQVAAQDVSVKDSGAHTGETGAFQIKEFCKFCIIGHSERNETRETIVEKAEVCIENEITPIICFSNEVDVAKYYIEGAIMTLEDPRNISRDNQYNPRTPQEIKSSIEKVKKLLPEGTKVLYGGSVNRENSKDLGNVSDLDGVLVGNASLDPKHFLEVANSF